MADGQRCATHGCWHETGTFCPMCISQMNGGAPAKVAPLGDLPRASATPQVTPQVPPQVDEGFGANDTPEPPKPRQAPQTYGKKKIGPEDVVWFGKHKGAKAKAVEPSYWVWAKENLAWLEVSPELIKGDEPRGARGQRLIERDTELWFGKYNGRPASLCPADYIVWLSENTNFAIDSDFLEDCRVEEGRP